MLKRATLFPWLVAALILSGTWLAPAPDGLSVAAWRTLLVVLAALPLLIASALSDGIISLLILAAWVVVAGTPSALALGGFATPTWFLVLSVLAIGSAVSRTGGLARMVTTMLRRAPAGLGWQVSALATAGALASPTVPNATARVGLSAPLALASAQALGVKPGSPAAAALGFAVFLGFGQTSHLFLTSSTTGLVVYGLLPAEERLRVDFLHWFLAALPTYAIVLAGTLAFVIWRARRSDSPMVAAPQMDLPAPSSAERWALLGLALAVVGFVLQPWHGIQPVWIAVAALALVAATGGLGKAGLVGSVNWDFLLFVGMVNGLGRVFEELAVDRWLAGVLGSVTAPLTGNQVVFILCLTLTGYALNLVVRWQAAAPLLYLAAAPLGAQAGLSPWATAFVCLMGTNTFFFRYQSTVYLAAYHGMEGKGFSHAQASPVALVYGALLPVALVLTLPIWRLFGLA